MTVLRMFQAQDIFTKLGYTETDFTSAGLTNFSVTTAGRNASDLEYVNAFWTGGATEGVTGSPQILQAYWDQSAAEGVGRHLGLVLMARNTAFRLMLTLTSAIHG